VLGAGVFIVLAVLATPALLLAHAHLLRSSPAANAVVDTPPAAIDMWFSEKPELHFTIVQLVDSAGAQMPLGAVAAASADGLEISVPVTGPLAAGKYTVVWHTAAADGHATSGKYTFTVRTGSTGAPAPASLTSAPAPATSVTAAPAAPASAPAPSIVNVSAASRWPELVALLMIIGAVCFRLVVLPRADWPASGVDDASDRARRMAQAALILLALAMLTRLSAESALLPASPGMSRPDAMWSVLRETRWGTGWSFGAVGLVVLAASLFFARRSTGAWIAAGIGTVLAALGETLTGHAASMRMYAPLGIAVDLTHILAAGAWLGALALLLLAGLPAALRLDEEEKVEGRGPSERLAHSFHGAAQESVAILVISAALNAWLRLGAWSDLWTTRYGAVLLVKIALVVVVLLFGLYHWRTVISRPWTGSTRGKFARSVTGELIVGALVLAVTAVLISTDLPADSHGASGRPVITHIVH
jgi:copper transport protein